MKTEAFISTISYNTPQHLERTLECLRKERKIAFWAFIPHKGEHDPIEPEIVDKDHLHVLVKPTATLDTITLSAYFDEIDPEDATKPPLGVSWWQKTKEPFDWIFYSRHDSIYLESKGEVKEIYDYPWEDFKTSDLEQFRRLRAKGSMAVTRSYRVVNALVAQGLPVEQILGMLNPGANQTKYVLDTIQYAINMQGRSTIQVDVRTGEPIRTNDLPTLPSEEDPEHPDIDLRPW